MGSQRKTTEQFIEGSKNIHGSIYYYSKVEYTNNSTKVLITCPIHGDFEQTPKLHLKGSGCPKCGNNRKNADRVKNAAKNFSQRASNVHNNKYDYSKVQYIDSNTKVIIICPVHGEFKQRPTDHLQGKGCLTCGVQSNGKTKKDKAALEFNDKASIVHDNKYDYSLVKYVNNNTKIDIICLEHGVFSQIPASHLRGYGCPSCAISGFDLTKPGTLYYLKITTDLGEPVYKIGITNRTVNERFNVQELKRIEVLSYETFSIGKEAYSKEQKILKKYAKYRYTGNDILMSGNTELFTKDVLGKDTQGEIK